MRLTGMVSLATRVLAFRPGIVMNCSFSGQPVPTEKLFILYYPPAAAHETFDKSSFAAARAREALAAIRESLESFFPRFVVTRSIVPGIVALLAGVAAAAAWGAWAVGSWSDAGFAARYLPPLLALILIQIARSRLRAFRYRLRVWRDSCESAVQTELAEIREAIDGLPDDPDAEEAAVIMRRECPGVISDLAFFGRNFRAFTYMDFVLSPRLRHPADEAELPKRHSRYRDAYYVGEVVYDNWRMFHKDRRWPADPRFVGSGGRRGVI